MTSEEPTPRRPSLPKFVRVVGAIWLVALAAILIGVLLAPHIGRLVDVGLHVTTHREWRAIRLRADVPVFDLSTPIDAVRSYNSALLRHDAAEMERLTTEPLQGQMRQRFKRGEPPVQTGEVATYRSYAKRDPPVANQSPDQVLIVEKFHLFWDRGLAFSLVRIDGDWRIQRVGILR